MKLENRIHIRLRQRLRARAQRLVSVQRYEADRDRRRFWFRSMLRRLRAAQRAFTIAAYLDASLKRLALRRLFFEAGGNTFELDRADPPRDGESIKAYYERLSRPGDRQARRMSMALIAWDVPALRHEWRLLRIQNRYNVNAIRERLARAAIMARAYGVPGRIRSWIALAFAPPVRPRLVPRGVGEAWRHYDRLRRMARKAIARAKEQEVEARKYAPASEAHEEHIERACRYVVLYQFLRARRELVEMRENMRGARRFHHRKEYRRPAARRVLLFSRETSEFAESIEQRAEARAFERKSKRP